MSEQQDIREMMKQAGRWVCLVGPQAAGKTTYSQYLAEYSAHERHQWSMVSHLRAAAGDLSISAVKEVDRLGPSPRVPAVMASRCRFGRVAGTRDIVFLEAQVQSRGSTQLAIPVFDVPGEWARSAKRQAGDPLELLLHKSDLFVFFISYWGLLPSMWLESNVSSVLGHEVWGTSMAGGGEFGVKQAALAIEQDVSAWIDEIMVRGAPGMDILVVLSQFQDSTVVPLLNAFDPGLGDEIWRNYDEQLRREPPGMLSLHQLARHVAQTEAIGQQLLQRIQARAKATQTWSDRSVVAQLLGFGQPAKRQGQRRERSKVRSWSILPMNILKITAQNYHEWQHSGCGDPYLDFRMCEDVLWWSMLHLKAHEFWRT